MNSVMNLSVSARHGVYFSSCKPELQAIVRIGACVFPLTANTLATVIGGL
jgi:hypothetical protein